MSVAFLCVQFRNLLPSEELLLFARALWADLQQQYPAVRERDATLTISQTGSDGGRFNVVLAVGGLPVRGVARERDALLAVQRAFDQASAASVEEPVQERLLADDSAPLCRSPSLFDPGSA